MTTELPNIRTAALAIVCIMLAALAATGCRPEKAPRVGSNGGSPKRAAVEHAEGARPPASWRELRARMSMADVERLLGSPAQTVVRTIQSVGFTDDQHTQTQPYTYHQTLWLYPFGVVRFSVADAVIDWREGTQGLAPGDPPDAARPVDGMSSVPTAVPRRDPGESTP